MAKEKIAKSKPSKRKATTSKTAHAQNGVHHSDPGPAPNIDLPVKTTREKVLCAFDYLETRWDPRDWHGLGGILFQLTNGSKEGKKLFDYWSYFYYPDFDVSRGISALWKWYAKGGTVAASMRTLRCFTAAGFLLEELLPEIFQDDDEGSESSRQGALVAG
jgi:hypothetical protein